MGILFFAIILFFGTLNLIFLLTKLRDGANQRKRFEEIDRFKAEQPALGNHEETEAEYNQLRKDNIHIWKE